MTLSVPTLRCVSWSRRQPHFEPPRRISAAPSPIASKGLPFPHAGPSQERLHATHSASAALLTLAGWSGEPGASFRGTASVPPAAPGWPRGTSFESHDATSVDACIPHRASISSLSQAVPLGAESRAHSSSSRSLAATGVGLRRPAEGVDDGIGGICSADCRTSSVTCWRRRCHSAAGAAIDATCSGACRGGRASGDARPTDERGGFHHAGTNRCNSPSTGATRWLIAPNGFAGPFPRPSRVQGSSHARTGISTDVMKLRPPTQLTAERKTAQSCGIRAMELGGLEPPTSWVRSRRSPN
jgi:hypothetical protein